MKLLKKKNKLFQNRWELSITAFNILDFLKLKTYSIELDKLKFTKTNTLITWIEISNEFPCKDNCFSLLISVQFLSKYKSSYRGWHFIRLIA